MYYSIGNSDSDILDLVVEANILYIIKEDSVFVIGENGIPRNIANSWVHNRQKARSQGGLWRMNPSSRRPAHPGDNASSYDEYNGPVTMAIGDDTWLYAFVQKRDSASPTTSNIMAGRPTSSTAWRWGQVAKTKKPRLYLSQRSQRLRAEVPTRTTAARSHGAIQLTPLLATTATQRGLLHQRHRKRGLRVRWQLPTTLAQRHGTTQLT